MVGLLFVGHGAQKLFGVFGGGGLEGTTGMFDNIGLRPGWFYARAAGTAEFAGGALIALGLFTPFAAAALIAAVFALAGVGAGSWSLDNAFGFDLHGVVWALAALVAGVIGGIGTVISGRTAGGREPHPVS